MKRLFCFLSFLVACLGIIPNNTAASISAPRPGRRPTTSASPPAITQQPVSASVKVGAPATFNVKVSNATGATYQWSHNRVNIPGATKDTYFIASVQSVNVGEYTVTVTNSAGATKSAAASLSVLPSPISTPPPAITQQPVSASVNVGEPATFSVKVSNATGATYQWFRNGVNIPGATKDTYFIASVRSVNVGEYTVTVTNSAGATKSAAASLSVLPSPISTPLPAITRPPAITQQPVSASVKVGAPATFNVKVSNATGATYQWFRNGVNISGATRDTYFIASVQSVNVGEYTVTVTNSAGATKSAAASLSVLPSPISTPPPAITQQPVSASVKVGAPATFSVKVSNATGATYQWFRNGVNILGAIAKDFSIVSARLTDEGTYSVSVTNSAGSVTSDKVNLGVAPAGMIGVLGGTLPTGSELRGQIVRDFQIGETEVTYGDWSEVRDWAGRKGYDLNEVGETNSREWTILGPRKSLIDPNLLPVVSVSWYDVVKWCNARSEKEGISPVYEVDGGVYRSGVFDNSGSKVTMKNGANGYRLPFEKEWEWAARGGVRSEGYTYSGSNVLHEVGWTNTGINGTMPVGTKKPNELGLYDMSGNVWELIWDRYEMRSARRMRGGRFFSIDAHAAVSNRAGLSGASDRYDSVGFRVARGSGQ